MGRIRAARFSSRGALLSAAAKPRIPLRGEIWFTNIALAPAQESKRAVIIVSPDARNCHERVQTVLVIPLVTGVQKQSSVHILLAASETGLASDAIARADNITVVLKSDLVEPTDQLRTLNNKRLCELAAKVKIAMGCAG